MLADLWDNKTRTLLVVASIAVGVFAIGAITSSYVILSTGIDDSYAAVNPANIELTTSPFDEDLLKSIEEIAGVKAAEGRTSLVVTVMEAGQPWKGLQLTALEDFESSQINLRDPREALPVPGRRQIVLGYEPMRDSGYRVGDVLSIRLADGAVREVEVVGTVQDQASIGDFNALAGGYVLADSLEWLGQVRSYNRLLATVEPGGDDEVAIQQVAAAIEDKFEKSGRTVFRTQVRKSHEHPFGSMALAIYGVLGALGVLVVLLSSSLIVNTLNALVNQHLRQIGVMKLVGARSRQISGMYLLLILAYGLLALLVGVPLGALAGYGLAQLMAGLMKSQLPGFQLVPLALVLQVLVALAVPLVAGYIPVRSGARIKIWRAFSSDRALEQPARAGVWLRLARFLGWLSRPVVLSIRNTFRRKGRLALTLITLTISGAIFIAVFNVRVSMQAFMRQIQQYFIADITLNFEQPYRITEVEQAVRQLPGVLEVEAWSGALAEIVDQQGNKLTGLQVVAPPAGSQLINPQLEAGRWLQPGDGQAIVLSQVIWDYLPELQPGDTVRLKVGDQREQDWTVVGIFQFMDMVGDPLSYAPYETIAALQDSAMLASSYRLVTDDQSSAGQRSLSTRLDQYLREQGYRVSGVQTGAQAQEQSAEMVNILVIFLLSMALLTAVVGSIGLAGTMGMNVLERTREIGVMRAIGAVDGAIFKSVVVEGALIGLISWAMAVVVSFPISSLLLGIISRSMVNIPIPLHFTLSGMLMWLGVVLALSVVASVAPALNAARLTIREVLAYE